MDHSLYYSSYDWQYATENDGINHQAMKNGSVRWPRGKMLGGGSSINAMIYTRGRDSDFKSWEEEGNPSWTPENVNLHFRKAESLQDMNLLQDPYIKNFYGLEGPLIINTFNSTYRELTEKILDSWEYLGFKKVKDINSADFKEFGISGIVRATASNSKRCSTYATYIENAKHRSNLKIVTGAFVTKILLNERNEAYGVEADVNGKNKTFYANKEVIISGGAVNSPQLLMLSGIGPREHLLSKNISCKINLESVGKNLQDHNYIPVPIYADEPGIEDQNALEFEVIKYMYNKSGMLAHNSFSDVCAFYSRNENMSYPEFQNHVTIIWKNSTTFRQHFPAYEDEVLNSYLEHNINKALYIFGVHLLHPFSRGAIHLRSSNPYDKPVIDYSYFEDERDVQATAEGIKKLVNIVNTPYFKSINAFVHRVNISQCNDLKFQSDDYWKCFLRNVGITVYHPAGTCKMGKNPENAVVDNFLRVYGAKKLRVIDASIMPTLTSGNTNAPCIMIGEMGADMIKYDHLGKL